MGWLRWIIAVCIISLSAVGPISGAYAIGPDVAVYNGGGRASAPYTGAAWGPQAYTSADYSWVEDLISFWHRRGGVYIGTMQFGNEYANAKISPNMAARDIHLDPFPIDFLAGDSNRIQASLHSPAWQERLREWLRLAIDAGVDGIHIDGATPNIDIMTQNQGGSFDKYTMKDFNRYLARNFSKIELNRLGIPRIDHFNYRRWLIDRNKASTWNQWPLSGLAAQFYLFEFEYARKFLEKFLRYGRQYARSKYGREFSISENDGRWFQAASVVDQNIIEFHYTKSRRRQLRLAASQIKMARAVNGKPVVILPEIAESNTFRAPKRARNLAKFFYSDIYSSGGSAIIDESHLWRLGIGGRFWEIPSDKDVVRRYNAFILDHPTLFENLKPIADVGVVYSAASFRNQQISHENSKDWKDPLVGYYGLSKILLQENIQHEVVFLPDTRVNRADIDLESLRRYKMLLLDDVYSISDRQARLLLRYVRDGGILLTTADTARWDEWGQPSTRPRWTALRGRRTTRIGAGTVVHADIAVGRRFDDTGRIADRDFVANTVRKHVRPLIEISGDSKIFVHGYRKSGGIVLHIMNYDYDFERDKYTDTGALVLSVRRPEGDYEAKLRTPDLRGVKALTTSLEANSVKIRVPSFEAYAVIELRKRKEIAEATRAAAFMR